MTIRAIATFILILGSGTTVSAETVALATGEWIPYTSEGMENHGFFSEIVADVCGEMGMTAQFQFYPWRRCFMMVKHGQIMGAFPYGRTAERAKEVLFSDKICESKSVFFHYGEKKIPDYTTLAELKTVRIGGILGYFYEETFKKAGLKVDYSAKETNAIAKLIAGRTDLLPLNKTVGWHVIRRDFPDKAEKFGTLETPYYRDDLKLIISKTYPGSTEFLNHFNGALVKVVSGSKYKSILKKYGLNEQSSHGPHTGESK